MIPAISIWGWISLGKCALVVAALLAWALGRKALGAASNWLGLQLVAALVAEGAATALSFQGENNLRVYDAYLPVEFVALLCYALIWSGLQRAKGIILGVCLTLYGLVLWNELPTAWNKQSFTTTGYLLGGLVLVCASVFALFRIAMRSEVPMMKVPSTWVLLSIVVFFGGSIPLLGLTNSLIERQVAWAPNMYFINDGLYLFRYGCVLVAVCIGLRNTTPSPA
ncbi:MAG: hypothetical protein JNN32_06965 [Flavobacteriales bacterium]|nr:hypothetical protein [Flavobacteriales bacterium]